MPVEDRIVRSFVYGKPAAEGDTATDGRTLVFRGKVIAWRDAADDYRVTLAGDHYPRVRRRLNLLLMLLRSPYAIQSEGAKPYIEGMGERAKIEHDDIIRIRPDQRPLVEGPFSGVWEPLDTF